MYPQKENLLIEKSSKSHKESQLSKAKKTINKENQLSKAKKAITSKENHQEAKPLQDTKKNLPKQAKPIRSKNSIPNKKKTHPENLNIKTKIAISKNHKEDQTINLIDPTNKRPIEYSYLTLRKKVNSYKYPDNNSHHQDLIHKLPTMFK